MLKRKIFEKLKRNLNKGRMAVLVTGARQVGKTYLIRKAGEDFDNFLEINFIEHPEFKSLLSTSSSAEDILLGISAFADRKLVKGHTLIFFDEVQECPEIITAIKFLVDEGSYRYVLSGSLLGIGMKDIRSVPVGYMTEMELFPLDFEEFITACGVSEEVIKRLEENFREKREVDEFIHSRLMKLFRLYLITGGMPAAVSAYLETNNIQEVISVQKSIITLYKRDIAKYDQEDKLHIENIFDMIPSELNSQNRRFIMKDMGEKARFRSYENSFLWLKEAGVAIPVYVVDEPVVPLRASMSSNLFKLFLCDTGLLAAMYLEGIQLKVLSGEIDIDNGALVENFAAIELHSHGFTPYYLNNRKIGELDFLVEKEGKVIPLELKSGRKSSAHAALDNMLRIYGNEDSEAFVFHTGNIRKEGCITYLPVYLLMFLKKEDEADLIYRLDLEGLK